jgi:hypothetical protein
MLVQGFITRSDSDAKKAQILQKTAGDSDGQVNWTWLCSARLKKKASLNFKMLKGCTSAAKVMQGGLINI